MTEKTSETTFLGKCNFRGNERIFGIKNNDRRQHMYVIGKTGVGKTALLKNIALQDIRAGRGIGIIDPHGEFVEEVLAQIPPERTNDVIYFNPVDSEYPIGFNVLEVQDQKYKHLVVSDLLGIFTKIWANVWSARMEYILQNCIMALLDTPGTTLLGIPRLLVDKDYRQKIIANVKDPVVRSFWVHEYETWRDQFRNEAIVPIQNKVNQFLNTSFIRNIVGQTKSTLNIPEIMNGGKILLVNVSKGRIGEDNAQLLGAMIITKIQLAAMERVRIIEDERKDFYLYVDEFQNFATDSFASILSEARKYRLNLILANQYVGQLVTDVSTKVRDAVFGNVGTMICFRVGASDAEELEKEFNPEFVMEDLVNLPNYHIYLKLMVDGITSRPFSSTTLPPLKFEIDPGTAEKIINVSRERYARPRVEVVDKIARWSGIIEGDGGGGEIMTPGKLYDTTCWNCGKNATVPFVPDGRRPVYCMPCLKQIEDGKLIPLPDRMPQVGRAKFGQSLEALGIGFESISPASSRRSLAATNTVSRSTAPQTQDRRIIRKDYDNKNRTSTSRPVGSTSFLPRRGEQDQTRFDSEAGTRYPKKDFRENQRTRYDDKPSRSYFDNKNIRTRPLVRIPSNTRSISLSQLKLKTSEEENESQKSGDQETSPRLAPDVSGLKEVLKEALGSHSQNQDVKLKPDSTIVGDRDNSKPGSKKSEKGKIVNPGDVIKF